MNLDSRKVIHLAFGLGFEYSCGYGYDLFVKPTIGYVEVYCGKRANSRNLANCEILEPTQLATAATGNTNVVGFVSSCQYFMYLGRVSASI